MKFLISTNVDGLHRRSGITEIGMAELHGNCYLEICSGSDCGKEYLRNFDASSHRSDHITGRKCDACGSYLRDSIINFGN
jgi:NAD-dependent SIR2 family protein deacetylase